SDPPEADPRRRSGHETSHTQPAALAWPVPQRSAHATPHVMQCSWAVRPLVSSAESRIMRRIPTSPRPAWPALGIALAAGPAAAQDFPGDWSGVAAGTVATLRIQRDLGGLHGSVHAPSWRAEPIPFGEIATAGDSIVLTIPNEDGV